MSQKILLKKHIILNNNNIYDINGLTKEVMKPSFLKNNLTSLSLNNNISENFKNINKTNYIENKNNLGKELDDKKENIEIYKKNNINIKFNIK